MATAALGATAVGQEQQTPALSSALLIPEDGPPKHGAPAIAARRARVAEATRSYSRTDLRGSSAAATEAAERGAKLREQSLDRLVAAADQRSDEIQRERARQRRLERQRQRELARQRRIEERNSWVVPVDDYEITATFGTGGDLWSSDHTGLDFAAPEGTPVGATASGEVTSTGWAGAYGNQVVVTHDDGTQTWYCHLSSIDVGSGEPVEPGTTIGAIGMTGNATGPHLHLEVRPGGGAPVDPYTYLQEQGVDL